MDNIALVTEIHRNDQSIIIGKVKQGVRYELGYTAVGEEFTMRFWMRDEIDSTKKTVINRICDVTDGEYKYRFTAPYDSLIVYHINGGKATDIYLKQI